MLRSGPNGPASNAPAVLRASGARTRTFYPAQDPQTPLHAPRFPPNLASCRSLTDSHSPHERHVPQAVTCPGTIHTAPEISTQQESQHGHSKASSPSERQQTVFRTGAEAPQMSQRISAEDSGGV